MQLVADGNGRGPRLRLLPVGRARSPAARARVPAGGIGEHGGLDRFGVVVSGGDGKGREELIDRVDQLLGAGRLPNSARREGPSARLEWSVDELMPWWDEVARV